MTKKALSHKLLMLEPEMVHMCSQSDGHSPNKLQALVIISHHEMVCVQFLKVTQAIHRWTGGIVVRQDDNIIIFRGWWALLPFYTAGGT